MLAIVSFILTTMWGLDLLEMAVRVIQMREVGAEAFGKKKMSKAIEDLEKYNAKKGIFQE